MRVLFISIIALMGVAGAQAPTGLDDLTRTLDWRAMRSSSANPDLSKNGDARPVPPGETLVLLDADGPGVVNHIWCTINSPDIFHGRSHVVLVYYDGAEEPSVEVPLGDFFGVGHGAAENYASAVSAVSSHGRARTCYWRMPFREHITIAIRNDSQEYKTDSFYFYVDWEKHEALPNDTVYLHARYRQENPTPPEDFLLLDTVGRGHYVGTVYSVQQAENGWFGEGDDRFYIDGESEPSLRGTGTEDYFADAWGFRKFETPYYGVTLWEGYNAGDRNTAYRWHIADPVPFRESLRVAMETRGSIFTKQMEFLGQFLPRQDFVSAVAFWYQTPAVPVVDPLPPVADRVAPYRILPVSELEVRAEPKMGFSQGKDGFQYLAFSNEATVEVDFSVPEDGRYQVNGIMQYGVLGGYYQAALNGRQLGSPIDFWQSGQDPLWTRFDLHDLKAGETYTLSFVGQGPSSHRRTASPPVNGIAMSHLVLLRLEDLPGYEVTQKKVIEERKAQ